VRFPALILLSLLAAYALSCVLTVTLNPEVNFWNEVIEQREAALSEIREKHPEEPIILFTGGSSCAFSINPRIIEETTGQPAINLGLPVSSGARYILHQALRQAQKGDLLVVCLEPDLLTYPGQESSPSKLGFALDARRGNLTDAAGGSTFGKTVTIPQYLTLPRPGPNYLITLIGRVSTGKGYRYKTGDIKYHGLTQTTDRDTSLQPAGASAATTLDAAGRMLLETFAAAAKRKGVHLAYSMPWYFTATVHLTESRANKQKVLAEISEIMPVIEDGYSGAMDGIEHFADSGLHLTGKGSRIRSLALANSLKSGVKGQ